MNKSTYMGAAGGVLLSAVVTYFAATYNFTDDGPVPAPPPPDSSLVVLLAPDTVKPGDLAVLDASSTEADSFAWQVVPDCGSNFMVIDDGRRAVFTSGKPGEYLFIIAVAKGGKVGTLAHKITVEGQAPTPSPAPPQPSDNIEAKVAQWCADVKSPTLRDDALKLSQSFASLSALIETSAKSTPMSAAEIVEATKVSNRSALGSNYSHWEPFFTHLQSELVRLAADGKLADAEAHAKVWREIGVGLQSYADSL